MLKRNDIKKQFAEMGYVIKYKTNSFNCNLTSIHFVEHEILNGNCIPAEAWEVHEKALTLRNRLLGSTLDNGKRLT